MEDDKTIVGNPAFVKATDLTEADGKIKKATQVTAVSALTDYAKKNGKWALGGGIAGLFYSLLTGRDVIWWSIGGGVIGATIGLGVNKVEALITPEKVKTT